jgi:NADH:ubiquinone oxidoreductase subunit K
MTPPALAVHLSVEHFLVVGALLFALGLFTALSKKNAVAVLFGIELMLNAVNLTLVAFSRFTVAEEPIDGQVFVIFILTVAAAEAAVGLAIAASIYRARKTVDVEELDLMKF